MQITVEEIDVILTCLDYEINYQNYENMENSSLLESAKEKMIRMKTRNLKRQKAHESLYPNKK